MTDEEAVAEMMERLRPDFVALWRAEINAPGLWARIPASRRHWYKPWTWLRPI